MRDPRNWARPAAAIVVGSVAAGGLVLVRARQQQKKRHAPGSRRSRSRSAASRTTSRSASGAKASRPGAPRLRRRARARLVGAGVASPAPTPAIPISRCRKLSSVLTGIEVEDLAAVARDEAERGDERGRRAPTPSAYARDAGVRADHEQSGRAAQRCGGCCCQPFTSRRPSTASRSAPSPVEKLGAVEEAEDAGHHEREPDHQRVDLSGRPFVQRGHPKCSSADVENLRSGERHPRSGGRGGDAAGAARATRAHSSCSTTATAARRTRSRTGSSGKPGDGGGRGAGGAPVDLAEPAALRPDARQRAHLDPRDRPQPRDRRAAAQLGARPPPRDARRGGGALRGARAYRRGGGAARGGAQRARRARDAPRRSSAGRSSWPTSAASRRREIAELLHEPVGTVKGRMRLGLDKMRRQLAGAWHERPRAPSRRRGRLPPRRAERPASGRRSSATCAAATTARRSSSALRPAADALPGSVEQLEPPPGLKERLMAEVEAATRPPRRRRTGALLAVAAALLLGLAVGVRGRAARRRRRHAHRHRHRRQGHAAGGRGARDPGRQRDAAPARHARPRRHARLPGVAAARRPAGPGAHLRGRASSGAGNVQLPDVGDANGVFVTREARGGATGAERGPDCERAAVDTVRLSDGGLLPPPEPRDRGQLLELRAADLPGLHDVHVGRHALPGVRAPGQDAGADDAARSPSSPPSPGS